MANLFRRTRVIYHNAGKINLPADPDFPFQLEVFLSPPEFMAVAFILMCGGSEHLIVQGKSVKALKRYLRRHRLSKHPRLISWTIGKTSGQILEEFPLQAAAA